MPCLLANTCARARSRAATAATVTCGTARAGRDGLLEGTLALGALDVDVNPLVIARQLGKLIDHRLRHLERRAEGTECLADLAAQPVDIVEANLFHERLLWRLYTRCNPHPT